MTPGKLAAAACLLALLFPPPCPLMAESSAVDDTGVLWAYGTVVDSVTVAGNDHTKTFVILREMETQPGDVLDRETLRRDIRFLNDLTPLANVAVRADSLGPGHCAIRIDVRERSEILIKAILPLLKYDFERGITYGVRWNNKNFRGRLENLSMSWARNEREDDEVSFGWSAPWIGWHHVSVGAGAAYYSRGDVPVDIEVLERLGVVTYVGLPLTESRVKFSQLLLSFGFDKSRTGGKEPDPETGDDGDSQISVSPLVGYRRDSRDSQIRPTQGWVFNTTLRATYPLDGGRNTYYRVANDTRHFIGFTENSALALLSDFEYVFGDFPSYSYLRLGGPESLRGQPIGRFKGHHRWYQTVEWRYQFIPRMVFELPIIDEFDVGVGLVTFVDTGIVWNGTGDFDFDHFHGTGGVGLQFFSPIQDVFRLDFGFDLHGNYRFHSATGVRF
jgi:outer membrane protein insertion porin family